MDLLKSDDVFFRGLQSHAGVQALSMTYGVTLFDLVDLVPQFSEKIAERFLEPKKDGGWCCEVCMIHCNHPKLEYDSNFGNKSSKNNDIQPSLEVCS